MNFLFERDVDRDISRKYRSIFLGFAAFLVTFFIVLLSPEKDLMKLNFLTILMAGFNITIGLFLCRAAARIESKMK